MGYVIGSNTNDWFSLLAFAYVRESVRTKVMGMRSHAWHEIFHVRLHFNGMWFDVCMSLHVYLGKE